MKPIVASILLALLVLPFGGTYIFLEFEKSKARKQAQTLLSNPSEPAEMLWLKFTKEQLKNELRWEHDREFEYNSQMYDVAKKEQRGDTTYLYVYWDKLESLINQRLHQLLILNMEGEEDEEDSKLISSLFKAVYMQPEAQYPAILSKQSAKYYQNYIAFYKSILFAADAPPPQCVA